MSPRPYPRRLTVRRISEVQLSYGFTRWRPDQHVHTYAGTGYANPHALTQLSNGVSTTSYAYDNNGNLTSAGNGTATTTYGYDYANRLISLSTGGASTAYGYDAFGARVYQIIPSTSTSTYPFKFFSIASTTKSSTNYATSTEYVFSNWSSVAAGLQVRCKKP